MGLHPRLDVPSGPQSPYTSLHPLAHLQGQGSHPLTGSLEQQKVLPQSVSPWFLAMGPRGRWQKEMPSVFRAALALLTLRWVLLCRGAILGTVGG